MKNKQLPSPELIALGKTIKAFRESRNISQDEFSSLIEVDRSYLSRIELSKVNPSFTVLFRITRVLKITMKHLGEDFEKNLRVFFKNRE